MLLDPRLLTIWVMSVKIFMFGICTMAPTATPSNISDTTQKYHLILFGVMIKDIWQ